MHTQDLALKEDDRIDTSRLNRHLYDLYTDVSSLYDFCFENLGRNEILNTALKLIDVSNKKIIEKQTAPTESVNQITIDSDSSIVYPESADALTRCDVLTNHRIILSKIVNKNRIFTTLDQERTLRPGISIAKSSHNYIFLSKPESIFESNINDILTGRFPYMIRFVGKDVLDAQLITEMTVANEVFNFNTIEYTPFPVAGLIELENATVNDEILRTRTGTIDFIEDNKFERTYASYIPFLPIKGNRLNLSFINNTRFESLNGSVVGIELIEAFETTYSSLSHFGYAHVSLSDTKLKTMSINGTWATPYLGGMSLRVYDNIDEFNKISDNYLIVIDDVIKGTLNMVAGKTYYFLFSMEITENYPIVVKDIKLTFE
jgi:hypothetical protein